MDGTEKHRNQGLCVEHGEQHDEIEEMKMRKP